MKFSLHDTVRVTDQDAHHYDELGVITDLDPEEADVAYRVGFPPGLTAYFAPRQLTHGDNQ